MPETCEKKPLNPDQQVALVQAIIDKSQGASLKITGGPDGIEITPIPKSVARSEMNGVEKVASLPSIPANELRKAKSKLHPRKKTR